MDKQTFTLTFGDCAENHKGMEKIGNCELESGLDLEDLARAAKWFEDKGAEYEIVYLNELLEGEDIDYDEDVEGAYLLIVKEGVNYLLDDEEGADRMFREQEALEKDKKAKMYGRVVNKTARHNLCFSDFSQEADYEEGKGTVVNFEDVPVLNELRDKWMEVIENEKVENLQCEGNYYYDVEKTFIGFHGDTERKLVIAIRLGANFPIFYQWYYKGEEIGSRYKKILSHGDVYIMSNKAVGWDWKKKNIYTLRHAAGFEKALKLKGQSPAGGEAAVEEKEDDGGKEEDDREEKKEIAEIKKIVRKGDKKEEIDIFQRIKRTSLLVKKDFKKIWNELSSLYLNDKISKEDINEKIAIKHLQQMGIMLELDKLSKYNGSNKEELVDRIVNEMQKEEKEEEKEEKRYKDDENDEAKDLFRFIKGRYFISKKEFPKVLEKLSFLVKNNVINRNDIIENLYFKNIYGIADKLELKGLAKYNSKNVEELVDRIVSKIEKEEKEVVVIRDVEDLEERYQDDKEPGFDFSKIEKLFRDGGYFENRKDINKRSLLWPEKLIKGVIEKGYDYFRSINKKKDQTDSKFLENFFGGNDIEKIYAFIRPLFISPTDTKKENEIKDKVMNKNISVLKKENVFDLIEKYSFNFYIMEELDLDEGRDSFIKYYKLTPDEYNYIIKWYYEKMDKK